MRKPQRIIFEIVSIIVLMLPIGCAENLYSNRSSITSDPNVSKEFESYTINPEFNYYICGSDEHPVALIGLNKIYTLDAFAWKKIEPTPKTFQETIQNMQKKSSTHNINLHGFAVLDDKGRQIGVWYSILSAKTSVQMKDDHTVKIRAPDADTYEKLDKEWNKLYKGV